MCLRRGFFRIFHPLEQVRWDRRHRLVQRLDQFVEFLVGDREWRDRGAGRRFHPGVGFELYQSLIECSGSLHHAVVGFNVALRYGG
ncbi:hypothetical protein KEK_14433 [Mycolicibacterium thermoresistibile ATCC 19527]|uniref:Uncharacterized protein n=1 Tax=Mycolicibacterium thermoresistibile (strain ATCC 19527 / DSM 44167 / CIP 105390 / JCM 6362 / NCTC 10409 / 316) TaxID=1078020 RepID=G7CGZ4_MYCT3|nr:hypothetical protein KEK_14433 [Mycolicibacterium thermoresistibile ATCC 19527]